MQRHATLAVPLAAAHLGTAETTGALDADALGTGLAGGLHSLAHGATESDAALELLGNGLGDEVGVQLGALDLDDLDVDRAVGDLLELLAQSVDLGALLADHDTWASRGDDDLDLVACALDLDLGDGGTGQLLVQELPNGQVVCQVLGVILVGVPTAAPLFGDTEAEPGRAYLLTHRLYASSRGATMMVMWQVRLRMREAEPLARGRMRLSVGPSSTKAVFTTSVSGRT